MHIYWNNLWWNGINTLTQIKITKVYWSKKQYSFILSKCLWAKISRLIKLYFSFPAEFCLDFSHRIFETSSSTKSNCISTFLPVQTNQITFHNVLITCLICILINSVWIFTISTSPFQVLTSLLLNEMLQFLHLATQLKIQLRRIGKIYLRIWSS